jgi:THO complex subunit 5
MKSKFRQVQLDTETKKEHALRTQELLKQPHAQLQNLLYEKRHLESEIKTCHSFKKAAENQVELIDQEQFFREAPPQFLPAEGATEHEVLMKRLQYELEQRKVYVIGNF